MEITEQLPGILTPCANALPASQMRHNVASAGLAQARQLASQELQLFGAIAPALKTRFIAQSEHLVASLFTVQVLQLEWQVDVLAVAQ